MRDFFPQGSPGTKKTVCNNEVSVKRVDCIFVSKLPFIQIRMCNRREEMRKNVPIKKTIKC